MTLRHHHHITVVVSLRDHDPTMLTLLKIKIPLPDGKQEANDGSRRCFIWTWVLFPDTPRDQRILDLFEALSPYLTLTRLPCQLPTCLASHIEQEV
jgi:hypothetical protein